MGMYDTLLVEYPLPDLPYPELQNTDWQTKEFDCMLGLYVLKADGTVVERTYDYEEDRSQPHPYLTGQYVHKRLDTYTDRPLLDLHCDVRFYEIWAPTNEWVEYHARFTDGKLTRIQLAEFRPCGRANPVETAKLLEEAERLAALIGNQTPPDVQTVTPRDQNPPVFPKGGEVCESPLPSPICQGKPHLDWDIAELDHIIPIERGGSNHPHNLRLLCPICHALRADGWHYQLRERMDEEGKLPEEWWNYTWDG